MGEQPAARRPLRRVVRFGCLGFAAFVLGSLLLGIVGVALESAGWLDPTPTPRPARGVGTSDPPARDTVSVRYVVTTQWRRPGDPGGAAITYTTADGGIQQADVSAFDQTFEMRPGQHAYISAQNNLDTGGVICEIYVDGRPWKRNESWGAYKVVTCSGVVGLD